MAYDRKWVKLSRAYLKRNRVCVKCGEPSHAVDHIVNVRTAPHRKYDPSNWQALCQGCHTRLTAAYDAGSLAGACDEDGAPLDPFHPWAQADNAEAIKVANLPKSERKVDPRYAATLKARVSRQ
jgi:hypothetical protein